MDHERYRSSPLRPQPPRRLRGADARASVTRAAERLGRTQSAVSHSCLRLRDQLGRSAATKGGRRMEPYRCRAGVHRAGAPPAAGHRKSAVAAAQVRACTLAAGLPVGGARFCARAVDRPAGRSAAEAPAFRSNRTGRGRPCCSKSRRDRSTSPSRQAGSACPRASSARTSERSSGDASPAAATRRPQMERAGLGALAACSRPGGRSAREPCQYRCRSRGLRRTIAGWVPNFSVIAPVLATSDLLATLPAPAMAGTLRPFGLGLQTRAFCHRTDPACHAVERRPRRGS